MIRGELLKKGGILMRLYEEAARCMLCEDAKCTEACPNGFDPARAVRAVRLENTPCAAKALKPSACAVCDGFCEQACIHYDRPIRIREMAAQFPAAPKDNPVGLEVEFLGVHCENPFFLSSSIVAGSYEMCAAAFEMGWAGAAFKTICFLTPREVSPRFDKVCQVGMPMIGLKNLEQISEHPLEENLEAIRKLKARYPRNSCPPPSHR